MKSFFREAIKSFKTTGSVKPSSKYLVRDCLKGLDFENTVNIIEFGSGNGCITEKIAENMLNKTNLYSFEVNPIFYSFCHKKFLPIDNVHILNSSAFDFLSVLNKKSIDKIDFIISSLPLAILDDFEIKKLLEEIKKSLKNGGVFIQYQYSLDSYKLLKKIFSKVEIDLTIRNLPPAFIYKCYV